MADKRIPNLNLLSDPQAEDLLIVVDDPSGTPVNKKVTIGGIFQAGQITPSFGRVVADNITTTDHLHLSNKTQILNPVAISVSGLNDISSSGTYTGDTNSVYIVEIDGVGTPDTFKWSLDGGNYTTGVLINSDNNQTLSNGLTINFASNTGHTVADRWYITVKTEGAIEFGGVLLLEDGSTTSENKSTEGQLLFESDLMVSLEQKVSISSNVDTIKICTDSLNVADNKIGFFGAAPVSKNTSTLTTISDVITELTRLGLIGS